MQARMKNPAMMIPDAMQALLAPNTIGCPISEDETEVTLLSCPPPRRYLYRR
jgi:hypothetical protein